MYTQHMHLSMSCQIVLKIAETKKGIQNCLEGFGFREIETTFKCPDLTTNGKLNQLLQCKFENKGFRQSTPNPQYNSTLSKNHQ